MPASPKKCWGKKVKFTPKNIILNWIFKYVSFIFNPVNNGYQKINPLIMVKTAPMDKT